MIPTFPEFKKVEVSDRTVVESHTRRYPPYSDFNFTSLWAWDTNNKRMISELNGNLVVRFTDYKTNEPFLSFLGSNKPNETASTLLDYAAPNGLPPSLKLMPEISVKEIDAQKFNIQEDRDNFDYVYSIEELRNLTGSKFETKRNMLNRFMRRYPNAAIEIIDLKDAHQHQLMTELLDSWAIRKSEYMQDDEHKIEFDSISRLFKNISSFDLLGTGVLSEGSIIAFSIDEVFTDGYAISHFAKADSSYAGAYDFLMRAVITRLGGEHVQSLNYEQDLGILNLRVSKSSFRPSFFLKKYNVFSQ